MFWTQYSEQIILNVLRGITAQAPNAIFAAAYISNPGNAGGGTEVSYTGYARQPLVFSPPETSLGTASIVNVSDIPFPTSPSAAGTITHFAVKDSLTGGNTLAFVTLDEPIVVSAGVAPLLLAGEWRYQSSGNFSTSFRARCLNWLRGINIEGISPHVALFNGNPDGGGAELSGGGYARYPVTFAPPAVQPSGQTMITNSADAVGPRATSPWGTWAFTAIYDAASTGEPVAYLQRDESRIMGAGSATIIDAGALSVSLN